MGHSHECEARLERLEHSSRRLGRLTYAGWATVLLAALLGAAVKSDGVIRANALILKHGDKPRAAFGLQNGGAMIALASDGEAAQAVATERGREAVLGFITQKTNRFVLSQFGDVALMTLNDKAGKGRAMFGGPPTSPALGVCDSRGQLRVHLNTLLKGAEAPRWGVTLRDDRDRVRGFLWYKRHGKGGFASTLGLTDGQAGNMLRAGLSVEDRWSQLHLNNADGSPAANLGASKGVSQLGANDDAGRPRLTFYEGDSKEPRLLFYDPRARQYVPTPQRAE